MNSVLSMKRIVIIGASSGLGMQMALDFASMGWRVGAMARRESRLEELRSQNPERIKVLPIDVCAENATDSLQTMIDILGGMDILLYAAGTGWHNPGLDPAKELNTVNVNVAGFTRIVTAAYHYFKNNNLEGRIAMISSVAGTKGLGVAPAYSASKRYEWNYLQALKQLIRAQKLPIGITDIRPGFMNTALLADDPKKDQLPMLMDVKKSARRIETAIMRGKRVATIDGRWCALCSLWRLLPDCVWERLRIML